MDIRTEQLFDDARSHRAFRADPVPDATLHALYELMKWGPTSSNCCPARLLFVRSESAKARLLPCMSPGNVEKTRQAPVAVIVGMDLDFAEQFPKLAPHVDVQTWRAGNASVIESTALRNSSLQGGYLILAARALGLDCGPMGGFDEAAVDAAFWAGTRVTTNFICNLGHGDPAALKPRSPRLTFDEACKLL